jgi:hypothetical protein
MSLSGLFLAHNALLGALLTPGNTDQTGTAWAILPSTTDDVEADQQKYAVAIHIKQIGAGTTRALVVTSHDGVQWAVAAASSVLTQAGQEIYEVIEPARLLRHVAVVTVLTGDPKPNHSFAASLLSNGRFQLMRTPKTVNLGLAVVNADVEQSSKAGRAVVLDGQSQVDVAFQVPWPNSAYTVVATPQDEAAACWITDRTGLGFRLHTSAPVDGDTLVHWMAVHD